MPRFLPRKIAPVLFGFTVALAMMTASPLRAGDKPASLAFHGKVYQVDTIFNFVDVIMLGGTKRFYADDSSIVRVHKKRAALIDIAMGEEVSGTYRVDSKGTRIVGTIDDLANR